MHGLSVEDALRADRLAEMVRDNEGDERALARMPYWERALQAVDPIRIDNPNPGDSEYRPEAEYFSRLEALGRLDFDAAVLVFEVMFGAGYVNEDVRHALRAVVG